MASVSSVLLVAEAGKLKPSLALGELPLEKSDSLVEYDASTDSSWVNLSVDGGSGFTNSVYVGSVMADIIVLVVEDLSLVLIKRCACTNNSSPGGSGFLVFDVSLSASLLFIVRRLGVKGD